MSSTNYKQYIEMYKLHYENCVYIFSFFAYMWHMYE